MPTLNTGNVALRNDDMYYLPLSRTNVCQRLPLTNIARVQNEFSKPEIKQVNRKATFVYLSKKYFIDRLTSVPQL